MHTAEYYWTIASSPPGGLRVAGVVNAHFQRSYAPGMAKSRDPEEIRPARNMEGGIAPARNGASIPLGMTPAYPPNG